MFQTKPVLNSDDGKRAWFIMKTRVDANSERRRMIGLALLLLTSKGQCLETDAQYHTKQTQNSGACSLGYGAFTLT